MGIEAETVSPMKNTLPMMAANLPLIAPQWTPVEMTLTASESYENPYSEVLVWMEFTHDSGLKLVRPAFWDGGVTWRVRFASPLSVGIWKWTTVGNVGDFGLVGRSGSMSSTPPLLPEGFLAGGLLSMSPGGRNVVRGNGRGLLLVGDTAWALPWRATVEDCEIYAKDRAAKGFNMVLLMTMMPDLGVKGPEGRGVPEGFELAFEDFYEAKLTRLRPEYFQYLDRLVEILVQHGIVPVYQPLFHGFGWKGKGSVGQSVSVEDAVRYSQYLVARYGAWPAIYLVGADGLGTEPTIKAAGVAVSENDCYGQPTGIHYGPHGTDDVHQGAEWLDFQWCQSGHGGEHRPEKVAVMWRNTPRKAVANGEPTYEAVGQGGRDAVGWWQGHEAWLNLCAGGTMGVVYGAGSLWSFNPEREEPGMEDWTVAAGHSWKDALDFSGSTFVGKMARVFKGVDFADMAPNVSHTFGQRGLLVPGKFFLVYLENPPKDFNLQVVGNEVPQAYRVWDLKAGEVVATGRRTPGTNTVKIEGGRPLAVVFEN